MQRFTNRTVVITGSSTGIGEAIARRFASEGANVVLNSRSRDDLEKVAADLDDDRTLIVDGDISDADFANTLVAKTVERFGGLDCLVNNAGTATAGPLVEASDEDIDKVIDINVKGTLYACRAAIPQLAKSDAPGGGSIVNTSSVSGTGGDWTMPIYNASKGAVTNLTRALALQLGAQGIRANAVCPPPAYPARPPGRARGCRRRGRLPRERGCALRDRGEPARRWRGQRLERPAQLPGLPVIGPLI